MKTLIDNLDKKTKDKKAKDIEVNIKLQGDNIVLTEVISNKDPYADLKNRMQDEIWYWDSSYDF
jgi:hypothetical protein